MFNISIKTAINIQMVQDGQMPYLSQRAGRASEAGLTE